MRTDFHLEWGPAGGSETPAVERAAVASPEQLDAKLDELERAAREGEPIVVELVEPRAGALGIGLGREVSVAYFNRADGEPPYLMSVGDPAQAGPGVLSFYFQGTWTEFPGEAAIPPASAREAMREFVRTRRPPRAVTWQEV